MIRSMYSGVSGMRSHQTSMDVIGNNIANVNTVGFKCSRTTFRDIYYQNMRGASKASPVRGGTNPSQVGVGAQVSSVDVLMSRSSFTQTDMVMDVAIDGEGFLQIMDPDGNKYYTRAGQLNFDAAGNLVDNKGNFVLGVNGDPLGKPFGSEKIQVNLGTVDPKAAEKEEIINNKKFLITTTESTKDGNVGISFMSDNMPIGEDVRAEVTEASIVVRVNKKTQFNSMQEFSDKVNTAIQDAARQILGQEGHPAGTFNITSADADLAEWPLTGEEITSAYYGVNLGSITPRSIGNGFNVKSVGSGFSANPAKKVDPVDLKFVIDGGAAGTPQNLTLTIDGIAYTGQIPAGTKGTGSILLKNGGSDTDYVEVDFSNAEQIDGRPFNVVQTELTTALQTATQNPENVLGAEAAVRKIRAYANSMAVLARKLTPPPGGFDETTFQEAYTKLTTDLQTWKAALSVTPLNTDNVTKAAGDLNAAATALLGAFNGTVDDLNPYYANNTVAAGAGGAGGGDPTTGTTGVVVKPSEPSKALGLSSKAFVLEGGTEGGPQGVESLSGISIGTDGIIVGFHNELGDESGRVYLGRIDLATFTNPQGLTQNGSTYFVTSSNSGNMVVTKPGENGAGQLVAGSLELSNVDLAKEFTEMIRTQRGYQANSRVITVSDTMLEELVNLKR